MGSAIANAMDRVGWMRIAMVSAITSIKGERTIVRTIIIYANWMLLTSVVSLVTMDAVL